MRSLGKRPSAFSTAEEIVSNRARREPLRPAIGWRERMVLLGRFADIVAERAEAIGRLVPPGEAIAQVMSDTPACVSTIFAIWRAGCTAVPLDPRLAPADLGKRLVHSGVAAVIAHEEHLERAEEAAAGSGALVLVSRGLRLMPAGVRAAALRGRGAPRLRALSRRSSGASSKRARRGTVVNDVAFHAYAGSTDEPLRAALLTHANVVASALRISIARGDGADDVALASHPSSDVAALVGEVLSRLIVGGAVAMLGPIGIRDLADRIEQHRVTDVSLESEIASRLVESSGPPRRATRSVRKVLLRDAGLPLTLKRELLDRFGRAELVQSHGYAEATDAVLTSRQGAVFRKPETLGAPHPGLVVDVVDAEGRPVGLGQRGEIVCRGAVVMRGYHRRPGLTAEVLRDGWLHTGDLGCIDADGELSLVGRRSRDSRPQPGDADRRPR